MTKGPELKLFGRNILLPDKGLAAAGEYSGESSVESCNGGAVDFGGGKRGEDGVKADGEEKQGPADEVQNHHLQEEMEEGTFQANDQDLNPHTTAKPGEIPKTPSPTDGPPKDLKKPDKILPCPRCKSPDTKFCYFNNYNVNQPRHFCKACQRYWTDGGAVRNVPVGSGRRKTKSHFPAVRSGPNGKVLSFTCRNGPGGPAFPSPVPAFYPQCYYYTTPGWNAGFSGPSRSGHGKRPREGEPSERSSIWMNIGVECDNLRREGLVKALQPRGEEKKSSIVSSSLLQANPAAFSRSISFRERA